MLRYVYGNDLHQFPRLADTMFRDRAEQFANRLGWQVRVDRRGHERDEYDGANPLYVIWQQPDGSHGGSLRFLPTVGPNMVQDHFSELTGGVRIESPLIWECTRFCLSPGAPRSVSAALVLGAGEVMENFHLSHFVAVFDRRMERIYKALGVCPEVVGRAGEGRQQISVGLWEMQPRAWPEMLARVGIGRDTSRRWFDSAFAPARRASGGMLETA